MTAVTAGNVNFKWDPKSLEIRTLAVERLLEPLVTQVGGKKKKRGEGGGKKNLLRMVTCFDVLFQLSNFQSLNSRSKNTTKLTIEKSVEVISLFGFIVKELLGMSLERLCFFSI